MRAARRGIFVLRGFGLRIAIVGSGYIAKVHSRIAKELGGRDLDRATDCRGKRGLSRRGARANERNIRLGSSECFDKRFR